MNVQSELFAEFEIKRSADFSPCGTYRYTLKRVWDTAKPKLLCVLLNPSIADEYRDDPTNVRCIKWAMTNGFGSLTFCNLFAFRTAYPVVMRAAKLPIGDENDNWIWKEVREHDTVWAGWGCDGVHMDRDQDVQPMCDRWQHYAVNQNGTPKHPLYMSRKVILSDYKGRIPE